MPPDWWDTSTVFSSGVPFAVDANGHWRDVSEVSRGKACGCFCAACHGVLVARQGEVRVHHFAHHDRKECRDALEASLYGMAIEILREPGARLRVPGPYDVSSLVQASGAEPYQVSRAIKALKVVPEQATMVLARPVPAFTRLRDATKITPDITAPDQSFAVHLLTSVKMLYMIERQPQKFSDVLAINPLMFARGWYDSVCDPDIEENLKAASHARGQFRQWLAESVEGRGWIRHREQVRVADLVKQHVEAERASYRPLRPAPGPTASIFHPRAIPEVPQYSPKPPPPDVPDIVMQVDVEKCRLCSAPMDIILHGSGLFAGKRLLVCRSNPKHPMRHLG